MAVNGHAGEQWPPKNKPTHERYINFKTSQDIAHRQGHGQGQGQKKTGQCFPSSATHISRSDDMNPPT